MDAAGRRADRWKEATEEMLQPWFAVHNKPALHTKCNIAEWLRMFSESSKNGHPCRTPAVPALRQVFSNLRCDLSLSCLEVAVQPVFTFVLHRFFPPFFQLDLFLLPLRGTFLLTDRLSLRQVFSNLRCDLSLSCLEVGRLPRLIYAALPFWIGYRDDP
jgi:hypothetical protein